MNASNLSPTNSFSVILKLSLWTRFLLNSQPFSLNALRHSSTLHQQTSTSPKKMKEQTQRTREENEGIRDIATWVQTPPPLGAFAVATWVCSYSLFYLRGFLSSWVAAVMEWVRDVERALWWSEWRGSVLLWWSE